MPTDTFTAADGTLPGALGYVEHADSAASSLSVLSNAMKGNSDEVTCALWLKNAWTIDNPADFSLEADFIFNAANDGPGILFVPSLLTASGCYFGRYVSGATCFVLYKVSAGNTSPFFNSVAVFSSSSIAFSSGTIHLKITYLDNGDGTVDFEMFADGVSIGTGTDVAPLPTITKVGIVAGFFGKISIDNLQLESAAALPDLAVTVQGGASVADAGTDTLGAVYQGASLSRSYTLTNPGAATLTLSGLTLSAGLTQTTNILASPTIAPAATKTLTVTVDTDTAGTNNHTISIASDDATTPYNWTISSPVTPVANITGYYLSYPFWLWSHDSDWRGGSGVNVKHNNCRSKFTWAQSGSGTITVWYANTKLLAGNPLGGEDATLDDLTIHNAAIEYPVGVFHPLSFNGSASVTLAAGEMAGGTVTLTTTAGETWWDRVQVESAGTTFPVNGVAHNAAGEGVSNTQVDETQNASATWTTLGDPANPSVFHHVAVMAAAITGTRVGVAASPGDSLNVYVTDSLTALGIESLHLAFSGEGVYTFNGSENDGFGSPVRVALARAADWIIVQSGINDVRAGRSAAQIEADVVALVTSIGTTGKPVYCCTLTPFDTSSDSWATLVNQTELVAGSWAARTTYNTWLRGDRTADGIAGYFEAGNLVANAAGGDKWAVSPDVTTADGTHPNTAGYALLIPEALDGAEDLFVLDRIAPSPSTLETGSTGNAVTVTITGGGTASGVTDFTLSAGTITAGNFSTPAVPVLTITAPATEQTLTLTHVATGLTATIAVTDTTAPARTGITATPGLPYIYVRYSDLSGLDTGTTPDAADFAHSAKTISAVLVTGAYVRLTCNSNFSLGAGGTLGYTQGTNKVRDASAAHNLAASFAAQAVTVSAAGAGALTTAFGFGFGF